MLHCQIHSALLQLQSQPVDCELHVELHIADESLQQPQISQQWVTCELGSEVLQLA